MPQVLLKRSDSAENGLHVLRRSNSEGGLSISCDDDDKDPEDLIIEILTATEKVSCFPLITTS